MGGWMLAHGRQAQQPAAQPIAPDAREAALPGADVAFAPDDPLFAGSPEHGVRWLGRVVEATPDGLHFTRPPGRAVDAGEPLWRAASVLPAARDAAWPERRRLDPGVAVEATRAGGWVAIRVAESIERMELVFDGLTPREERALLDWLAAHAGWGLEPFALIDPAGEVRALRLSGEPLTREADPGDRRRLRLPVVVVGEGIYP